jgi:hypothetical protein
MMDVLTAWKQLMRESPFSTSDPADISVPELVQDLLRQYTRLWWSCERTLPAFQRVYTSREQQENEKALDQLVSGLMHELKHIPADEEARAAWQEKMRGSGLAFARKSFNLKQGQIDFIESSGMLEASRDFARMARKFDSAISAEDIYQASRNVMTMNLMQLLLGLPVSVTPSVFAYSMLYPYTDNYLDNPTITRTTKLAFNHRFQRWLMGEDVRPANAYEKTIRTLVTMIEDQWDRDRFPQVYESLLAIHAAQVRSMSLVAPGASPYEYDVLGISFEKGGTSVLADGYLVAGWLTPAQAAMMFGYGAFTQLMDDLEDVHPDMQSGSLTIFSQTARHWPLDGLTNRVMHFGRAIFSDLSAFQSPAVQPLKELMDSSVDPLLVEIAGQAGEFYSREYLREIERYIPFRFSSLRKQRERLARQKINLSAMLETFVLKEL